jgi:hypothetical protein
MIPKLSDSKNESFNLDKNQLKEIILFYYRPY